MSGAGPGRIPPCPECGGRQVGGAKLASRGAGKLALWRRRAAFFEITKVQPFVCVQCGRVGTYVENLAAFRQQLQNHPDEFWW
jgi:hypothetical protein